MIAESEAEMRRLLAVIFAAALTGCTHNFASTYTPDQMGRAATVMKGKVLAVRSVTISGSQSGVGAAAGAVGGGVAGSYAGGGTRANVLGAVGGAAVGGVAGAVAEEAATRSGAMEFVIHQDNGQDIAVVQTNDENLAVGERVLILRSDKVRLIRDQTGN